MTKYYKKYNPNKDNNMPVCKVKFLYLHTASISHEIQCKETFHDGCLSQTKEI